MQLQDGGHWPSEQRAPPSLARNSPACPPPSPSPIGALPPQGPTVSRVYTLGADGHAEPHLYAATICVPKKRLYPAVKQIRKVGGLVVCSGWVCVWGVGVGVGGGGAGGARGRKCSWMHAARAAHDFV
jgi:hypothetical protein